MADSLTSAAQERKARLAQLKSLKRKAPDSEPTPTSNEDANPSTPTIDAAEPSTTAQHLSGRNYDATTRGPRLGFESAPSQNGTSTLEARAQALSDAVRAEREAEDAIATGDAADNNGSAPVAAPALDLFKLQPKKPNWDLKRELDRRLVESGLNVATERAVAKLVRERIGAARGAVKEGGDGIGVEGTTLVEATKEREREDEEDARRERELEQDLE